MRGGGVGCWFKCDLKASPKHSDSRELQGRATTLNSKAGSGRTRDRGGGVKTCDCHLNTLIALLND